MAEMALSFLILKSIFTDIKKVELNGFNFIFPLFLELNLNKFNVWTQTPWASSGIIVKAMG